MSSPAPDSITHSSWNPTPTQALILWKPNDLFSPTAQELLHPNHRSGKPELELEVLSAQRDHAWQPNHTGHHTSTHEAASAPFILNQTFLRSLRCSPPPNVPLSPSCNYAQTVTIEHEDQDQSMTNMAETPSSEEEREHEWQQEQEASNQEPRQEESSDFSLTCTDYGPEDMPEYDKSHESTHTETYMLPLPISNPQPVETQSNPSKPPKPTKIVLKRKTPEPTYSYNDVFSASVTHNVPHLAATVESTIAEEGLDDDSQGSNTSSRGSGRTKKRSRTSSASEDETTSSVDQWRVGKTPGHQGSHTRAKFKTPKKVEAGHPGGEGDGESGGKKRTFGQSIASSVERVLKKPFRPPTRISLKSSSRSSPTSDMPHSSHDSTFPVRIFSPTGPPDRTGECSPKHTEGDETPSFLDFLSPPSTTSSTSQSHSRRKGTKDTKLAKPFRTPLRSDRSTAPSPSSKLYLGTNADDSHAHTHHPQVIKLQREILDLGKALKIVSDDAENQVSELIVLWRDAGREVVERLFDKIPRPEQTTSVGEAYGSRSGVGGRGGYESSIRSNGYWGGDASSAQGEIMGTQGLTQEQIEYLRNAPRNADGDPLDEDGNVLISDGGEREEKRFWDNIGKEGSCGETRYRSLWPSDTSYTQREDTITTSTPSPAAWNYAALMRLIGVDPALLGYDEEEEEWVEYSAPSSSYV